MTGPALLRTPGQATPLAKLPEAMRSLWRAAGADTVDGDVARSLTINFVGVAAAADELALREATDRLLRRTPCRAFLLLVDDRVTDVSATVAAASRCVGSTQGIVLEEIVIRMPTRWFDHVPGLVRPLLMNDLPNHLYWATGWPRQTRHFDSLAQLCDHVIVDTQHFVTPAIELDQLHVRRGGRRVTDLAWLRLRPWRRALAEAFERIAWTPGTATACTIRHGRHATSAAILLGQWLEQRLAATVALEDTGADATTCPESVRLRSDAFEIELGARGQRIAVHASTNTHCSLPFSVPTSRGAEGDLLAAAIDIA